MGDFDSELLLEAFEAHLVNEGGDLLEGVGGLGQVPGGVTVQVSKSEVVNLAQLSLWKKTKTIDEKAFCASMKRKC